MSDTVIRVENLGKKYIIGHQKEDQRYTALRDVIADKAKTLGNHLNPFKSSSSSLSNREEFWALKDVSFEIKQGDRVGIIGRNGAGKSTLLKILGRIVEPTSGFVELRGRAASLLEVGTGFHPELTGRENIFLNGAILGMSKAEISRKFDEIVSFAEVEKFLDTPVKRYSSGMYVRLAFAVAAYLEPEILIVDEVLAVGDAQFQKKCLEKMDDFGKEGRTVVFVSHQMAAIEKLCSKGVLINQGKVDYFGSQTQAVTKYLSISTDNSISLYDRSDRRGNGDIKVVSIDVRDAATDVILESVQSGQSIDFYFHYTSNANSQYERVIASISFATQLGIPVFLQHNRLTGDDFGCIPKKGTLVCKINRLPLPPSSYQISYSIIRDNEYLDSLSNAVTLSVLDGNFYGSGEVPPISHGVCLVDASWHLKPSI